MSPLFSPVSAGGIPKATYTATTGSPTIDTSSRAGKTIIKYAGSGSITIGTAGTCEVLVVGGGGSGGEANVGGTPSYNGCGGGGGGGYLYNTSAVLPSGTLTVTVGAGGAIVGNGTNQGFPCMVGPYVALGGGGGGYATALGTAIVGASGGGASQGSGLTSGGVSLLSQGNTGGGSSGSGTAGGGGGGAGAAGQSITTGNNGGNGGNGLSNSITGSSASRAGRTGRPCSSRGRY